MRAIFFSIVILLVIQADVFAQSGVIRGRVYNSANNEPVPFANIIVFGTNIGSTSDLDGNFTFTGIAPGFVKLAASSVGFESYISEEIQVTNARTAYIDIPMQETSIQLEQVVVKAFPFRKTEESPVSMRTLGIGEIEKSPGAGRDISKVIQALPGVATTVSFRNDLLVRGGGPAENRFYLDGMEIPNLNHFATQGASGGPIGIVNTDFIREVDFYSGAFPANRGNALSSVLEMRMVDGNPERIVTKASVGASDLSITLNGPLMENTTFLFSARRSYLSFLFDVIGLPFLPTYNDFQFKVKTRLDQKNEITILGIGAIDQFKLNTGLQNPDEGQKYILDYLPVNEQWNYAIGAVYRHYRGNSYDTWVISRNMLNNVAYKHIDNNENLPRTLDYVSQEMENKIRYENTSRISSFKFLAGAGGEYARYTTETFTKVFIPRATDTLLALNYGSEIDLFKYHVFGQLSRNFISDRLVLSLGLRTDGNSYSESMANPLQQLSPRFSAAYALTGKLFLNFNTGRYFQMPAYTTLGYRDSDGTLLNKLNKLRYIESDHLVAGLEYRRRDDVKVTLEGFYKLYGNYPVSVTDSISLANKGGDFGVVGNEEVYSGGKGRSYGLELYVRERLMEKTSIILSYTLVRSEFKDVNGNFISSAWDNGHLLNLTLFHEFKRNWSAGVKWRFAGGTPYTPWDIQRSSLRDAWEARRQGYPDIERFNTERTDNFQQLDLRIDKEYFFERFSLNFYIDVQNLYNYQQQGRPDLITVKDASGRDVVDPVTGNYSLKEVVNTSGTLLPSVGIIVEF